MTTGTEYYYARRAPEYDRVYGKPERQGDIRRLSEFVDGSLSGRRVLDVAAGTAFWTARYADRTRAVAVVDVNPSTLDWHGSGGVGLPLPRFTNAMPSVSTASLDGGMLPSSGSSGRMSRWRALSCSSTG